MRCTTVLPLLLALPAACLAAPAFHTDDLVGVGVLAAPVHAGADRSAVTPVPVIDVERGAWIVRTTQGVPEAAAVIGIGAGIKTGLAVFLEPGRRSDDVAAFAGRGIPDLDPGVALGPIVEASFAAGPVPMRLTGRWRQGLRQDSGASADLRFAAGLHDAGRVRVNGFAQLTWSDATARSRDFGLPASVAAPGGMPAATFGAGVRDASVGVAMRWDVAGPWSLVASIEHRRLDRALRAGPVAENGAATAGVVGVVYRLP